MFVSCFGLLPGVMPLTIPHHLQNGIKSWKAAVAPESLTIGFGSLYAAWGDKSCGAGPAGVNQTGCLAKSLAACHATGITSISIFEFNAFGCGETIKYPMCQIAGPWPPESWWPLLHTFATTQMHASAGAKRKLPSAEGTMHINVSSTSVGMRIY